MLQGLKFIERAIKKKLRVNKVKVLFSRFIPYGRGWIGPQIGAILAEVDKGIYIIAMATIIGDKVLFLNIPKEAYQRIESAYKRLREVVSTNKKYRPLLEHLPEEVPWSEIEIAKKYG